MPSINRIGEAFLSSFRGVDSPRQLAMGVAFGVMLGLIPVDSLFFFALAVVVVLSSANLLCLIIATLGVHLVSPSLDPVTHVMGQWVLVRPELQSTWIWLAKQPLASWTNFNNTVVMGSLLLGLVLLLPTYLVFGAFFGRFRDGLVRAITRSHFFNWLIGSPRRNIQEV